MYKTLAIIKLDKDQNDIQFKFKKLPKRILRIDKKYKKAGTEVGHC